MREDGKHKGPYYGWKLAALCRTPDKQDDDALRGLKRLVRWIARKLGLAQAWDR